MTKSIHMANETMKPILPNTLGMFKVISATLDTVKMNENCIRNAVSIDSVTFAPTTSKPRVEQTEKSIS